MNDINTTFRLTALATALLAAYAPAFAEDDALRELTQPDSSVSVGAGYWSNDRLQQGIYDGMRHNGLYGLIDLDVVRRDEASGTWTILRGERLGLDTRRFEAEWLRQGSGGVFLNYQRIPREHPLVINTGLQGIGHDTQVISGAGANALPFRKVELGTYRDLVHVGFAKHVVEGLDVKVSYKNEEKSGARHWGLGSQPFFLTEPIDSTTRQLDVTLEYTGERLQLAGGYGGSWYRNGNDLVMATVLGVTANTTSAPNPTPLSLPLDNEAHQFFVNAGYSLTPTTRATFKASRSVATQDETLPTITLGGPNAPFVGTPSNLDGEIVTSLVELGLTARPTADLSLAGGLRYYDVDDRTPLAGFVGNNTTGEPTVHNTPHSYTTNTAKLEAAYRLPQRFKLIAGVDVKQQDRSAPKFVEERFVPFAEEIDETTYRLQLRRSMSDTLNGALTYLRSERDGSSRVSPHDPEIFDAINPLHIADRTRDKWRLSVDWAPVEAFGLQFNVEEARDRYHAEEGRPFGLDDGRATLVSIDARYALNDKWQATAFASHDVTRAKQFAGRWERGTGILEIVKDADLEDRGDSVGLGLRGTLTDRLRFGADVQWTRSQSKYDEDTAPTGLGGQQTDFPASGGVTAVRLPDIETRLTRIAMFARYAARKNADVQIDLVHERWKSDDWSWSFADGSAFTYGTTTDRTTVAIKPKEVANFVGVRYIYRFQ